MEFKGTKGKWELSNNKTHGRQMIDLGEFKGSIDVWYHSGDSMTKEEAEANALLISKAPEMLEMLKKINHTITLHGKIDNGSDLHKNLTQLIKESTEL
jgi:hypothetical protein